MNIAMSLGGLLAILAVAFMWQAREFARDYDWRGFWKFIAIAVSLASVGAFAVWFGVQNPNFSVKLGDTFGAGWECYSFGNGAGYCLKDVRPTGQPKPPPPGATSQ